MATATVAGAGGISLSRPAFSPWLIAISVMLATFMEVLDTSIASVALPHIAGSLSATNDEATWVLTSYLVANAVILPASPWFSLQFGRKRFLISCIVIFTVSSFACGAATSLGMILLARAIQGAGGGALQPLSQAILIESFPPDKRGLAFAVFALGVVVAPVSGPDARRLFDRHLLLAVGLLHQHPDRPFCHLHDHALRRGPGLHQNAKPGRIDGIGLGLLAVWLGCLQIVLDKGQEDDWFGANWIRWAVGILVVAFILFIVRELKPTSHWSTCASFDTETSCLGCILIGLFGGAIYGLITLLPLFYQELLGYTASAAGWAVSPRGIGAIIAMPIIGILTSKLDNRWLIASGFAMFGVSSLWFGRANLEISQWSFLWPVVLSGFGAGFIFVPLSTTSVAGLPNEEIGNASGLYNLFRNVGGSIGIAMVNTIVARHAQLHQNELVRSVVPSSVTVQNQLHLLQQYLQSQGYGAVDAMQKAYALIGRQVGSQALLWSYVDDFRYMGLMCFACIPIVFILKKAVSRKGATGVGH